MLQPRSATAQQGVLQPRSAIAQQGVLHGVIKTFSSGLVFDAPVLISPPANAIHDLIPFSTAMEAVWLGCVRQGSVGQP